MSRRFKGRHARVQADPHAKPATPVALDKSNSFVPFSQPDMRHPNKLRARVVVRAESAVAAEREARESAEREAALAAAEGAGE